MKKKSGKINIGTLAGLGATLIALSLFASCTFKAEAMQLPTTRIISETSAESTTETTAESTTETTAETTTETTDETTTETTAEIATETTAETTIETSAKQTETTYVSEKPEITSEDEGYESVALTFAGDCTLGEDPEYTGRTFSYYAENEGFGYFFSGVRALFESDDFTFVNLEGPLTVSSDIQEKEYTFKGPPEYASILTEGSVEGVTLANNHAFDYGQQGYDDTLEILKASGIYYAHEEESFIVELKGIRIGYLGYKCWSYEKEVILNGMIRKATAALREKGAQYIVVNFHWGTELSYEPDPIQQRLARYAIDKGADLVVGHHPHVMQGREVYKGKTIMYSLGNFSFGGSMKSTDRDTIIFKHVIFLKNGVIDKVEDEIIPAFSSGKAEYNDFRPVIAEGEEADRILEKFWSLEIKNEK